MTEQGLLCIAHYMLPQYMRIVMSELSKDPLTFVGRQNDRRKFHVITSTSGHIKLIVIIN